MKISKCRCDQLTKKNECICVTTNVHIFVGKKYVENRRNPTPMK